MKVVNPANGKVMSELVPANLDEIRSMYHRGRKALEGWARLGFERRRDIIKRYRDILAEDATECAAILTSEVGKPLSQSLGEINGTLGRIDWFLKNVGQLLAIDHVVPDGSTREEISYEPIGVVANISAWNYPYFVGSNVFIPALLTGNVVLYKPSEYATLTGKKIGELMQRAGVPADVFQVVIGGGATGNELISQPVDGVFFTGSYATGKSIMAQIATRMVKVQMELGGKDPIYVTEDVDIRKAASGVAEGIFYNSGQGCCSVERLYVHEAIYEEFLKQLIEEAKTFRVGSPTEEGIFIGPLTRPAQLDVLSEQVADAAKKGAKLLMGGKRMPGQGNYFEPTLLGDCDHSMLVMTEESFGPICGIQKVKGDDQALEMMNDSEYGLTSGVYCRDEVRARRLLGQLRSGTVYWNCCDRVSPMLPWSGRGHSGVGVTLSLEGIRTFLRPRAWHLRPA